MRNRRVVESEYVQIPPLLRALIQTTRNFTTFGRRSSSLGDTDTRYILLLLHKAF